MLARMAETAGATGTFIELFDFFEIDLHNRHKNQLRNAFADMNGKSGIAPVPAGDKNLALVVGVNQTNQIA